MWRQNPSHFKPNELVDPQGSADLHVYSSQPDTNQSCKTRPETWATVKPLMFACPLFHDFHESVKIAKFNGANIEFQILENSTSLKNRCQCILFCNCLAILNIRVSCDELLICQSRRWMFVPRFHYDHLSGCAKSVSHICSRLYQSLMECWMSS